MKKTVYLFVLVMLVAAQGRAQTPWIIGGSTATQGQLPWVGNIVFLEDHYCGASLISPRWAITAGHCSLDYRSGDPLNPDSVRIRFNSITSYGAMSAGGVEVAVKKLYTFPDFDLNDFGAGYDIALVELATPVTSVTPIALPLIADTASLYSTGNNVKVAGWGLQDTFSFSTPHLMKWCATKVYDFALCDAISASHMGNSLSHDRFCAGYSGGQTQAGAAAGDSGGPVWKEDGAGNKTLLGVVSGGFASTTLADLPGYYTKVALYRRWADSIMAVNTAVASAPWTDENIRVGARAGAVSIAFGELGTDAVRVALYGPDGREVYGAGVSRPSRQTHTIDNRNLPAGLYILRISGAGGLSYAKKLANPGY